MNHKPIIWILVFVLLSSVVFSVKDTQVNTDLQQEGIAIIYPKIEYVSPSSELILNFKIFNSTNYYLDNTTTDCYVHIYNNSGHTVIYEQSSYSDTYKEFENIFTDLTVRGEYSMLIFCNNSDEAGYISTPFFVSDARNRNSDFSLGIIILLPLLISFLLVFISFSLGDIHSVVKIFLMLLSLVFVFISWNYGIVVLVEYYGMPQLQDAIGFNTYWYGWIFYIMVFYIGIYLIYTVIKQIYNKKNERLEY